jgi:hypothetical protein
VTHRSHWLIGVAASVGVVLGLAVLILALVQPLPNQAQAKLAALHDLWAQYRAGQVTKPNAIVIFQDFGIEQPGFGEAPLPIDEEETLGYPAVRRTALTYLGQIEGQEATDALVAVMDRRHASVFVAVMDALAHRRDPNTLKPLTRQLQRELQRLPTSDEIDGLARISAVARAISSLNSPQALAVLRQALTTAQPPADARLRFAISTLEAQLSNSAAGMDGEDIDPATGLPSTLLNRLPADSN